MDGVQAQGEVTVSHPQACATSAEGTPVLAAISPVLSPVTSPAHASCDDRCGTGDRGSARDGSSTEHTPSTNTASA